MSLIVEDPISKKFESVLGELRELIERANNSLTFNNLALAERYTKGKLRIVVRFSWGLGEQDYCAFFQVSDARIGRKSHRSLKDCVTGNKTNSKASVSHNPCSAPSDRGSNWYDHSVCIEDVELVEVPQSLVLSSLVGLERAGNLDSDIRSALYFFSGVGFSRLRLPVDWEARFAPITSAEFDALARHEVKSRSEVVNSVADENSDLGRNGDGASNDTSMALPFFVVITRDNQIRVGVKIVSDSPIDIKDVGFGPFDL